MTLDALLAWLHFIAIFATVALLALEVMLTRTVHLPRTLPVLTRIDLAYFAAAMATLGSGLLRLFFGAKGSAFYLGNPVFWGKMGLFLLIGVLSIPPTLQFARWARALRQDANFLPPPAAIATARRWLLIEMLLLAMLPGLAALMARGLGW